MKGAGSTDTLAGLVTGPTWSENIGEGSRTPAFLVGGDVFSPGAPRPRLPGSLAVLAVEQLAALVATAAIPGSCEVEMWPAWDDRGRATWVVARWRSRRGAPPRWVDSRTANEVGAEDHPRAIVPELLDPSDPAQRVRIFADALAQPDLYTLPSFAGCVWTTADGDAVMGWLDPSRAHAIEARALAAGWSCRRLPPPARNGQRPVVLRVELRDGAVRWGTEIDWLGRNSPEPSVTDANIAALTLPADFPDRLLSSVRIIAGESDATFADGRRTRFLRRSAALPDHQLGELVEWLEQRYAALGVRSERITFRWRGLEHTNLIAVLPGQPADEPVILADHIDTAFAEEVFAASGVRVPVPGADDNAIATATLLAGAELLRDLPRRRPIWLVHLTGEEYPSDDLGARQLVAWFIARRIRPYVWIQLDMLGWRVPGDCVLQLSPSDDPRALGAAALAARVARQTAPRLCPALRAPDDPRSYLYNTDAMTASAAGIPTFLVNEHVNARENIDRPGYHHMADTVAAMDPGYAADAAAVALVTTLTLAR